MNTKLSEFRDRLDQALIRADDAKRFALSTLESMLFDPNSDLFPNILLFVGDRYSGRTTFAELFSEMITQCGQLKDKTLHGYEQWRFDYPVKMAMPEIVESAGKQAADMGRILWLDFSNLISYLSPEAKRDMIRAISQAAQRGKLWMKLTPHQEEELFRAAPALLARAYVLRFSSFTADMGVELFRRKAQSDGFTITKEAMHLVQKAMQWCVAHQNLTLTPAKFAENLYGHAANACAMRREKASTEENALTESDIPKPYPESGKHYISSDSVSLEFSDELFAKGFVAHPGILHLDIRYLQNKSSAQMAELFGMLENRVVCFSGSCFYSYGSGINIDWAAFMELLSDPKLNRNNILIIDGVGSDYQLLFDHHEKLASVFSLALYDRELLNYPPYTHWKDHTVLDMEDEINRMADALSEDQSFSIDQFGRILMGAQEQSSEPLQMVGPHYFA